MWNWISKAESLRTQGIPFAITTITQVTGSAPRELGAKMLVLANDQFFGTIGGGRLEQLVLADAKKCIFSGNSRLIRYPLGAKTGQCCGGIVDILIEAVNSGPKIYLFGAGHVGQAICKTLGGTLFTIHVIDERLEWINSPEIPQGVIRHAVEFDDFIEEAVWDNEKIYVVIMTHRHDLDQAVLEKVINKPRKYLGLIGSRAKWLRFRQRLIARGITEKQLEEVKCPIGLKIGGKSPQEVAISLAAELIQNFYMNSGNDIEPDTGASN